MFTKIIHPYLTLKLFHPNHSETLFNMVNQNRDYLREWLPWIDQTQSIEDSKKYILSTLKQYAENNGFQTGIWFKDQLVGCIGLHAIDWFHRKTSIGYWLDSKFQGKGIMTDSCQAVIHDLFKQIKLNRIEIRCASQNLKSRRIPEKLGFVNEGTLRQNEWLYDHFVDHVVYGILASDWTSM